MALTEKEYSHLNKVEDVRLRLRISASHFRDAFRTAYGVNPKPCSACEGWHGNCLRRRDEGGNPSAAGENFFSQSRGINALIRSIMRFNIVSKKVSKKFAGVAPSKYRRCD
jgi:hypothetical protein